MDSQAIEAKTLFQQSTEVSIDNLINFHLQTSQILTTPVWKPLRYLNFYRIFLAALFAIPIYFEKDLPILGSHNIMLFLLVSHSYLLISMFSGFAIHWKKPNYKTLAYGLSFLDITVLTLLMHASGGIQSGLGLLIVVAVAGGSLLTEGRTARLFAAMGAIAILTEQVYSQFEDILPTNYTHAGTLGITLFAMATLAHVLSRRIHETEAIAAQRGIDLANMAQVNEFVIKRLQSGILVVDPQENIRLINDAAIQMLGLKIHQASGELKFASKEISQLLHSWKKNKTPTDKIVRSHKVDILPNFTRLGTDNNSGTLIFLEDSTRMSHQAQQMKLASLGRLTAGIAHEIRNPLGAISHAEQLLAESNNLDQAEKRLTQIIHTHTSRVNAIIENVLQLSRRGNRVAEDMVLKHWLDKFLLEFRQSENIPEHEIGVIFNHNPTVNIDPSQMHQVLWNILQNSWRYSAQHIGSPKLEIFGGVVDGHPYLDIVDHGPGIDPETAQSIFEPFFTTDAKGSGLGLYIARELCEINKARLSYLPMRTGGSCFRIEFSN
ncbi:MAG: ATP-binding protein [Gammaproteobacteria bacterium]|nr:ATP-binding protein [Gammaproteobacteria bacterium]MDH5800094.1 ATP-binding protein [Gammaproteobacteria bacterium]